MPGSDCVPYPDVSVHNDPIVAWFEILPGDILATGYYNGAVTLHSIEGIEITRTFLDSQKTAFDIFKISQDTYGIVYNNNDNSYLHIFDINEPTVIPENITIRKLIDSKISAVLSLSPGIFVTSHANNDICVWSWRDLTLDKIFSIQSKSLSPITQFYLHSENTFYSIAANELTLWQWHQNELIKTASNIHSTSSALSITQLSNKNLMSVANDSINIWNTKLEDTKPIQFHPVNTYVGRQAFFSSGIALSDGSVAVTIGHKVLNNNSGVSYDTDIVVFDPESKEIQPEFVQTDKRGNSSYYNNRLLALPDGNFAAYDSSNLIIFNRNKTSFQIEKKHDVHEYSKYGVTSTGLIIRCSTLSGTFFVYNTSAVNYPLAVTEHLITQQGLTKDTASIVVNYLGFFNSKPAKPKSGGKNVDMSPSTCIIL